MIEYLVGLCYFFVIIMVKNVIDKIQLSFFFIKIVTF